jgi:hypothetical protein
MNAFWRVEGERADGHNLNCCVNNGNRRAWSGPPLLVNAEHR